MIFNLGSINADYFYDLPHLVGPGETLAASKMSSGLGGKGANQSVAAALAGSEVCHIGAIGSDGDLTLERLSSLGVDTRHVRRSQHPTAHAIVMVGEAGENQIVIYPGANMDQDPAGIDRALAKATSNDWLILQNETSHQVEAARMAFNKGMSVAYSAAPFDVDAVQAVMPYVTLLIMNEVEASQLQVVTGKSANQLSAPFVLVTKGRDGAVWFDTNSGETVPISSFSVEAVDTTGAGDTFVGYTVAGLSEHLPLAEVLRRASAASAIAVTRKGTADAIPDLASVMQFLKS